MKKTKSPPQNANAAPSENSENKPASFKIAGIGASAGGLEAFEEFFQHMPEDSGIAFVLVPHLDPSHASLITEILQRSTRMPVVEVQDQMTVAPNHVYVIPPNRDMEIFHSKIQLSLPNLPHGQRLPVDVFLRSLAEDQKENAIGIIFSGTGSDGTLGCRAILGNGGVTFVQKPSSARYEGMPSSVIQAGYATWVWPVDKIPEALMAEPGKVKMAEPEKTAGEGETGLRPKTESGMMRILLLLRSITGHDFSLYKESTIGRRLERRMMQNDIKDTETYLRYLKEKPDEVHILFKELLINVTNFFRDPEAFAFLEKKILPQLCKDKPEGAVFRVWVAGCATGEEAYSIAMLLRELMDAQQKEFKVQIYSTDLDEDAIATARTGFYPPNIAQDVTPERLRRFFVKEDNGYRVKKEIREMIVFAMQNVIKDPPFTKLDLLSCRNLLIYLKPELQEKLIPAFHYALKSDGVLFLSPSESVGNHHDLFKSLDRKWKVYRAVHSASSSHALMTQGLSWGSIGSGLKIPEENTKAIRDLNIAELTRRILVQFFAPASVVIDHKGEILFIHGETGKYLRPAPGQPSHNIIEMAREGLGAELRTTINMAVNEKTQILNRQVLVKTNGDFSTVNVSVRPVANLDAHQNLFLVSFEDLAADSIKPVRKRAVKPSEYARIEDLEHELEQLKTSYRASIEEQQASNEELKSANEEMQSTNEELQSTNEELETSKEELQSVNEELITVNSELQAKIEQLAGMQNDMKNLLDNINVGIIFLDRNLIIRRFTREAVRIYRLVASDVGRPLNDIKSVIDGEDLHSAAHAVLESLIPYERELYIGDNTWMMVRIQPYRTLDNIIDGVVLTFTDITSRKTIAEQDALIRAESLVNPIREPLIVLNDTFKVMSASQSFYKEFGTTPEKTIDCQIDQLSIGFTELPELRELLENVLQNDQPIAGYSIIQDIPGIGRRRIEINASRITGKVVMPQLILLSLEINP